MDLVLTGDEKIDRALINIQKQFAAPVINIYVPLSVSADYTFTNKNLINTLYVTTGSSTITITVPSDINRQISIIKVDSGSGKVTVSGSINGVSSIDIELQYRGISVASTGAALVITGTIGECEIQTIGSAIELVYKWSKEFTTDGTAPDAYAHGIPNISKVVGCFSTAMVSSTLIYGYSLFSTSSETIYIAIDATNASVVYASTYNSKRCYVEIKYYI